MSRWPLIEATSGVVKQISKEAADGLVAQVVEMEVRAAGSTAYAFPGQPECVGVMGGWHQFRSEAALVRVLEA